MSSAAAAVVNNKDPGHLIYPTGVNNWTVATTTTTTFRDDVGQPRLAHIIMYPREATIFAAICCVLFVIVGTLGNLVTILALWRCKKLRNNATTSFIFSLCFADFLFCTVNMPLTVSRYIHEAWIFGDTLCTLFPLFFYGNVGVSLMSMTAITINRYVLIAHHHRYDRIYQPRNIALMIAFVWAFSFAILIPPLIRSWGQFGYSPETFSCTILRLNGRSPKKFLFLFGFLLPCIVIVLSYSCIFYRVRQSHRNLAAYSVKEGNSNKKFTEDVRLTRLMLIIFVTFIVCFLPLMVTNVFDDGFTYPAVHVLASVLSYASSCINPLIYAMLNRQYRHAYGRVLGYRRLRGLFSGGSAGATATTAAQHQYSAGSQTGSSSADRSKTVATEVYQYNALIKKAESVEADANGSKPIMVE